MKLKKLKENTENPKLFMLIGVPASGKSTWIKSNIPASYSIISSDDIIEKMGAPEGLSYNQAWKKYFDIADKECKQEFSNAIRNNDSIVIDRTNMSVGSRRKWLAQTPNNYEKIAIVFNIPEHELRKRSEKRERETGKIVDSKIVHDMLKNFQFPTKQEGFDKITEIN